MADDSRNNEELRSEISKLRETISELADAVSNMAKKKTSPSPRNSSNPPKDPDDSDDPDLKKLNKSVVDARQAYIAQQKSIQALTRSQSDFKSVLSKLKSPVLSATHEWSSINQTLKNDKKLGEARQALLKAQIELYKKQGKTDLQAIAEADLKLEQSKDVNRNLIAWSKKLNLVTNTLSDLSKEINALVKIVRGTQQQFGITAGDATKLRFDNLVQSVDSFITTLKTAGKTVPVTAEQIRKAQEDFQAQFGGIIDENSARELAEQATTLGLTTQQLADARRVFATQTMGDIGSAIQQQDRFIAQFEARGLTAKDAMQFIGSNSELLARSGTRFQQSMSRAAAEARRIGVDLSKVNQVGDNIIGNFEGFLESMAELGAMGFGFDSTRLAEVAERGDTGALFEELRSQLRMTGKDITQLRRSEQLALSSAFGMNIEDFQRMSGTLEEPVIEKLQKEANGFLEKIANRISRFLQTRGTELTNLGQAVGGVLEPVFKGANWALQLSLLGGIYTNTLLLGGGPGLIAGALTGIKSSFTKGLAGIKTSLGSTLAKLNPGALIGKSFKGGQFMTGGGRAVAGGQFAGGPLSGIATIFAKIGRSIQGAFTSITTPIRNAFTGITAPISKAFTDMATTISKAFTNITTRLGNILSRIPGVSKLAGMGRAAMATGAARVAARGGVLRAAGRTGPLAGVIGGVSGFMQAREQGMDVQGATGAAGVRGGAAFGGAALGATIGTMIAPGVGTAIGGIVGGFLGDKLGEMLVEKAPGLSIAVGKMFGTMLETIKKPFTQLSGPFNMITGQLKSNIDGVSDAFSFIGKILGEVINISINAFIAGLNLLGAGISLVSGLITTFVQLISGDFKGAWETIKDTFMNVGASLVNAIISAINMIPFVNIPLIDTTAADDMVSRPGYGERTLVTPTAAIALNNDDNIVAYADDMIARNTGVELLSKGAIVDGAKESSEINVKVDLEKLERKLDQVISAMNSMQVVMDGNRVGRVISSSEQAAATMGVFRTQRL